jgi:hypothetical protein
MSPDLAVRPGTEINSTNMLMSAPAQAPSVLLDTTGPDVLGAQALPQS